MNGILLMLMNFKNSPASIWCLDTVAPHDLIRRTCSTGVSAPAMGMYSFYGLAHDNSDI